MLRGHHVLICLRDVEGNYLLGHKKIYPLGISRFVGGAIEGVEQPTIAAGRELAEETGLNLPTERLTHHSSIIASITDQHDRSVTFTTYLYQAVLSPTEVQQLQASDDIDDIVTLNQPEFAQLVINYDKLPTTIDPDAGFAWADYGQLYGFIHSLVKPE